MVVEVPGEALKRTINEIISMDVIHPNRTEGEQHGVSSQEAYKKDPVVVAAMPRLSERGAFNPQAGYDKRDIELYLLENTGNAQTKTFRSRWRGRK